MKKVLITSVVILSFIVVSLVSLLIGLYLPKPGGNGANPPAPNAPKGELLPGKKPAEYKIGTTYEKAMKGGKPILAVFYANWCGFCMKFMPKYEELSKAYKNKYNFVMLDVDDKKNAELVKEYAITFYPSVFLINPANGDRTLVNSNLYGDKDKIASEMDKYIKDQSAKK